MLLKKIVEEKEKTHTGATILPVCPTCISFGTNPASTAALDAPTTKKNNGLK